MNRKKYITINGAKFKLELIEGIPPPSITIGTPRGISALRKGAKHINNAYQNKDLVNVDWSDWWVSIPDRKRNY